MPFSAPRLENADLAPFPSKAYANETSKPIWIFRSIRILPDPMKITIAIGFIMFDPDAHHRCDDIIAGSGTLPADGGADMIEKRRFGRIGRLGTATMIGADALENAAPGAADRALDLLVVDGSRLGEDLRWRFVP